MLVRRLARPLISSIFIYGGVNALRQPEGHAAMAEPVLDVVEGQLPDQVTEQLPKNRVDLIRIDGAVKIVAGSLLALNRFPRVAALALAGSLIPTTAAGHRFWEAEDPAERDQQIIHFLKNAGLLGGLMLAAVDTEGKPSVAWWARRGARQAAEATRSAAQSAADATRHAAEATRDATSNAAHAVADAVPL